MARKQPIRLVAHMLPRIMFGAMPYGAVPTADSMTAVTRDSIVAAQRDAWHPERATLIITGGLDAEEGYKIAEQAFGEWKAGGSEPAPRPRAPAAAAAPRIIAIDMPDTAQTAVVAALPTVGRGDKDWLALRIANARLGGGFQGWLTQEIRAKRGLSYSAGSVFDLRRDAALLMGATLTKNESAVEVAGLMLDQIARLGREPMDAARITERAAFLANGVSNQTERATGLATYLATLVANDTSLDLLKAEQSVQALPSPGDVAAAVSRHIRAERATLIVAGDAAQWIDALRARFPAVERVDVDGKPIP